MRYFVAALLLHAALLAVVLVGIYFHPMRRPEPVIEAVLIKPRQPKPAAPAAPAPEPSKPVEEQKPQEEKQKQQEEQKHKEQQIAEQKRAEVQRKIEQEKAIKLQQEKEKEQERKRAEAEKKLKQMEEQERQQQLEDEEKRRKQAEEKRQKEQEQRRLQELSNMMEQEQEGRAASERARWAALIQDKVRRNWIRPINSVDKFQCSVNVQILPGGTIANVKLNGSCGSPVLDESVKRAVLKSDPLPMPADPSVFDRNLNFTFVPGTN